MKELMATTATTPLLTAREAAERLNVSLCTARRLIKRGELPALKIGGGYRVDPARTRGLHLWGGRLMPRYRPHLLEAQEKSLAESADMDKRLDDAIPDERQRHLDELASKESPVAPGFDRDGMPPLTGVVGSLAELETQSRHRLSPRRNRWADVAAFDERAAEFDARRTEVMSRLTPLQIELGNSSNLDAQALSNWLSGGEKGPRPESVRPALEEQIADLQREADALVRAATDEMARKAQYVKNPEHVSSRMHVATSNERLAMSPL
jgi:excisionase family DNA binding protein